MQYSILVGADLAGVRHSGISSESFRFVPYINKFCVRTYKHSGWFWPGCANAQLSSGKVYNSINCYLWVWFKLKYAFWRVFYQTMPFNQNRKHIKRKYTLHTKNQYIYKNFYLYYVVFCTPRTSESSCDVIDLSSLIDTQVTVSFYKWTQ